MTEQFNPGMKLGVSPRAIIWYQCSFKTLEGAMISSGEGYAVCRSGPGAEPSWSHRWNRRERAEWTEP